MKQQMFGLRVAGTIFGVVACIHLLRLLTSFHVIVGNWEVPLWLNGLGAIITGGLCVWLWALARLRQT